MTNELLYSAGFAAGTAWNVENMGIKAIAKRSAKEAGVAFLKDLGTKGEKKARDSTAANENPVPSSPEMKKK